MTTALKSTFALFCFCLFASVLLAGSPAPSASVTAEIAQQDEIVSSTYDAYDGEAYSLNSLYGTNESTQDYSVLILIVGVLVVFLSPVLLERSGKFSRLSDIG